MNPPEEELEETFLRASGPGGQHRNRRETGVRLKHLPTGLVVTATERRSQAENRALARERLVRALVRLRRRQRRRIPTRPGKAAKERRLQTKKARAQTKAARRRVEE